MTGRDALVFGWVLTLPARALAEAPMAYFHTVGPAADPITRLGWGLGVVSIAVVVIIAVLLLVGIFRRRRQLPEDRSEQLAVRRDAGGMQWIYIGVGVSTIVLIACMIWTLVTIGLVKSPAVAPVLTIQITASQWWWSLRYANSQAQRTFITANEIHIPVGQPVRFELSSADVIHSFWVPKLAGKMDIIPGQTNVTWLQANRPGVYRGQCAVFCGAQHAHMAFVVVAQTPQDFAAWLDAQLKDAPVPVSGTALAGAQVFQAHCAACHTVRGSNAAGLVGPDLTHLMARRSLAAGLLPNTPGNLAGWISHPQGLKPGSDMPNQTLSGLELANVMAYLNTLQ